MRMPQRLTRGGIQRCKRCSRPAGEQHAARGGKQTGCRTTLPLVAPFEFAGLVVDRLKLAFRIATAVVSAPSLGIVARVVQVVHAERQSPGMGRKRPQWLFGKPASG